MTNAVENTPSAEFFVRTEEPNDSLADRKPNMTPEEALVKLQSLHDEFAEMAKELRDLGF